MVTGILAYFSTNNGAVPFVRSMFSPFPSVADGLLYLTVCFSYRLCWYCRRKRASWVREDRLSTAGIAKEPSHATPNNQLAAFQNSIVCMCENLPTVIIIFNRCKIYFYFRGSRKILTTKISRLRYMVESHFQAIDFQELWSPTDEE